MSTLSCIERDYIQPAGHSVIYNLQFAMAETPYRLEYYLDDNGKAPFLGWLYSRRDKMAVYRIRARLDRVELGNFGQLNL